MQVEAKRKCVFAGIRPFLFGEFGASPRCKFPVKCVLPGYISPFVSSRPRLCRCCSCSRGGNAAQVERGFQKYRALRITYTCSLLKKKKNPISPIILILLLPQLVCSRFNILPVYKAQFCSRLLYHNHLARCLDSNWWIVAPRVGRVWYICSRATLFYQPHLQVTVQCSQKVVFFPPLSLSVLAVSTPQYTRSLDAVWQA